MNGARLRFALLIHVIVLCVTTATAGSPWATARTLRGGYGEACGYSYEGTSELKCGKANARGLASVTLTITPFSGKKTTYKNSKVRVNSYGSTTVNFGSSYSVTIYEDDSYFGEPVYGDVRPACSPSAVWDADIGGKIYLDYLVFDCGEIDIETPEGFVLLEDLLPYNEIVRVKNGTKLTCGKAVKIAYRKYVEDGEVYYDIPFPECDDCTNYSGLSLSYNYKTGVFKGSFSIYMTNACCYYAGKPTLKKYKVSLSGVLINGEGLGTASVKIARQTYSWPICIYCGNCIEPTD